MRKKQRTAVLIYVTIFFATSISFAADCGGGYSKIYKYDRANGTPCVQLGLDSHQGTCLPGQPYAILCDDKSKGRYRICQGHSPCRGYHEDPRRNAAKYQVCTWDYAINRPCPPGYLNIDCYDSCETAVQVAP